LGNPEGICLMFQNKQLVEEKPLLYYEIKDGDTLYALNRQESGMHTSNVIEFLLTLTRLILSKHSYALLVKKDPMEQL
jgi:hypothetical protein